MATKKKTTKKAVKKLDNDNPNITRTFENGKMIVTFKNGQSREVTKEQLQTRLANVPTMIENRTKIQQKMLDRITERISKETDVTKKARMEQNKARMIENQSKMPTQKDIEDRLQGWINAIDASV